MNWDDHNFFQACIIPIGRAATQGGMATSGEDEGFISVSSLRRQFEKGPNKLTGTTITPVSTLQQLQGILLLYGAYCVTQFL